MQVQIHISDKGFNGVLYVKGHSKDAQCRRVVTLPADATERMEIFKVQFGNCGLIHVNVSRQCQILVIFDICQLTVLKSNALLLFNDCHLSLFDNHLSFL